MAAAWNEYQDACGLVSTLAPLSSTLEGMEFGDFKALSVLEGHQVKL